MSACRACLPDLSIGYPTDDNLTRLYTLEGPPFSFVLNCPPGFDCSNTTEITLVCCDGTVLHADLPSDYTTRSLIIGDLIQQYLAHQAFCLPGDTGSDTTTGDNPPSGPPNVPPDDTTPQMYANDPQTCSSRCPDGSYFYFTQPAGTVIDITQTAANHRAHVLACQQAQEERICMSLSSLPTYFCEGVAVNRTVAESGVPIGVAIDFSQTGTLPTGLTFNGGLVTTGQCTITGTPTTAGMFTFRITAMLLSGWYVFRDYTIRVIKISVDDTSGGETILAPGTLNVAYPTNNFTYAGTALTSQVWSVSGGALPPGLNLDSTTGALDGTPITAGHYAFTIEVTGLDGTVPVTCSRDFTMDVSAGPAGVTAYWTLNEAAGTRADSAGNPNNDLLLIGPEPGNVVGLQGNALPMNQLLERFASTAGNDLPFATTDPGVTIAFWFKLGAPGASTTRFYLSAQDLVFLIEVDSQHVYAELQGLTTNSKAQVDPSPGPAWGVGTWHLIVAEFITGTLKTRISIDGGAWVDSLTTADIAGATTAPSYFEGPDAITAGGLVLDEMLIVSNDLLTDPQVAYLYNAGAGRTWPLALP